MPRNTDRDQFRESRPTKTRAGGLEFEDRLERAIKQCTGLRQGERVGIGPGDFLGYDFTVKGISEELGEGRPIRIEAKTHNTEGELGEGIIGVYDSTANEFGFFHFEEPKSKADLVVLECKPSEGKPRDYFVTTRERMCSLQVWSRYEKMRLPSWNKSRTRRGLPPVESIEWPSIWKSPEPTNWPDNEIRGCYPLEVLMKDSEIKYLDTLERAAECLLDAAMWGLKGRDWRPTRQGRVGGISREIIELLDVQSSR